MHAELEQAVLVYRHCRVSMRSVGLARGQRLDRVVVGREDGKP
jgi:hypothetical protein